MADPNAIPDIKSLAFGKMSSKDLCEYLDLVTANEGTTLSAANVACINQAHTGPILPIYSVSIRRLPKQVQAIVMQIRANNDKVVNFSIDTWHSVKYIRDKWELVEDMENSDPAFANQMTTYVSLRDAVKDGTVKKADKEKYQRMIGKMVDQQDSLTPDAPGSMRSWHQNDPAYLPLQAITPDDLDDKALMYHDYINEHKGLQNKQKKKGVVQTYTGYVEFTAGGWIQGIHDGRVCYDYVNKRFFFTATHYQIRPDRIDKNPWWQIADI